MRSLAYAIKIRTPTHSESKAENSRNSNVQETAPAAGKLQTLAALLARLRAQGARCLIFTQMSKMLDLLEAFLNLHGHAYLRLDGSTKPAQRQALMTRFNASARYFCFILSTRSGGVGINLTGANCVVFYDSDWNPAMDQQAQVRAELLRALWVLSARAASLGAKQSHCSAMTAHVEPPARCALVDRVLVGQGYAACECGRSGQSSDGGSTTRRMQDRCHRIGQTRDVHIYRLVSEHTVEENILRKSNQKRHLDHLAIQSGGFTTAALAGAAGGGGGGGEVRDILGADVLGAAAAGPQGGLSAEQYRKAMAQVWFSEGLKFVLCSRRHTTTRLPVAIPCSGEALDDCKATAYP